MWGMIATWRMAAEGTTAGAELLAAGKSSGDAVETAIRADVYKRQPWPTCTAALT